MNRRDFLQMCSLLGLTSIASSALLAGCNSSQVGKGKPASPGNKSVLIIGAGAAGLTAGFLLQQQGIPFEIIEASPRYGGRLMKDTSLADFPLDLGAEWIHEVGPQGPATVLNELSADPLAQQLAEPYLPQTCAYWDGNKLHQADADIKQWRDDWRFKASTWFDFFDEYIAPSVLPFIRFNTQITEIDHSAKQLQVTSKDKQLFTASQLIFTAPLKILKEGDINFNPPLPLKKQQALQQVDMPKGLKCFMRFEQKFYPDALILDLPSRGEGDEALFYNEALDKDSSQHVLGFFCHGLPAEPFTAIESDALLVKHLLTLLDNIYQGQASLYFSGQYVVQNWVKEPFIRGTYSSYFPNMSVVEILAENIDNRIFFAGEAYAGDTWGFVHAAARSARRVANQIITQ